ncbi:toxin-antitoxin system YwqK family antitoxin [Haloglycomyces albus]|uniref:toxin-antitoxin system YwqK family antitoxin n=1 Tax=Haloglycomyces albus TaxID=526067 RepID=UPI00046CA819|nr:hypothetical protein [Haloglycomyces albus]
MQTIDRNEAEYDGEQRLLYRGELFTGLAIDIDPDVPEDNRLDALYLRGVPNGIWKEYDSEGRLIQEVTYEMGAKHGLQRDFDTEGRLTLVKAQDHGYILWTADIDANGLVANVHQSSLTDFQREDLGWARKGTPLPPIPSAPAIGTPIE